MSDNWLQFIPNDPLYQPTPEAAERGRKLLVELVPNATAINARFESSVAFFHPGGNWSGVKCPACGADAKQWWPSALQTAWKAKFADLNTTTLCCGALVSLNDLQYASSAGFARFVLEAMNPDVRDLQPDDEQRLRLALGCELRKIWKHI